VEAAGEAMKRCLRIIAALWVAAIAAAPAVAKDDALVGAWATGFVRDGKGPYEEASFHADGRYCAFTVDGGTGVVVDRGTWHRYGNSDLLELQVESTTGPQNDQLGGRLQLSIFALDREHLSLGFQGTHGLRAADEYTRLPGPPRDAACAIPRRIEVQLSLAGFERGCSADPAMLCARVEARNVGEQAVRFPMVEGAARTVVPHTESEIQFFDPHKDGQQAGWWSMAKVPGTYPHSTARITVLPGQVATLWLELSSLLMERPLPVETVRLLVRDGMGNEYVTPAFDESSIPKPVRDVTPPATPAPR
jgi:hypothetical protein